MVTGDYSFTDVKLYGNLLTRFEEDVFKSMLQDMQGIIDGSFRGTLDVNSSMKLKINYLFSQQKYIAISFLIIDLYRSF